MAKNAIVIGGSGGREHALAWKLSQSPQVEKVYIAPGNGGTSSVGENVDIKPEEVDKLISFCREKSMDLIVIGPDDLLASGLADKFRAAGFAVFGASRNAARIESSKAFAKDMMKKTGVPTAKYETFTVRDEAIRYAEKQNYPLVVKASGLALGKGVLICENFEEAGKAIDLIMVEKAFDSAGDTIIIEEFLEGIEVSFHAISDGSNYAVFPPSQDHKQVFDGDKGPNTGGMGAFGPVAWVSKQLADEVDKDIIAPILKGLERADSSFVGCLYPGMMITRDRAKVLEYNARFGDPETQVYMRLLDCDLFEILYACATGKLDPKGLKWKDGFAVTVVMASGGYPGNYDKGIEIHGIEEAEKLDGVLVFHAGTALEGGRLTTSGGRVLNVTAHAATLDEAITKAYEGVSKISFERAHYRKDIGLREVPEFIIPD
ncbi:MAG TPA: phosphoribosylamine--glycine ligase [Candidatus Saccharimonadales bacterium]|nr:phosphoribosylamine--glycine ligase [Candidatus Saccharimonadales bacterium]